MLNEPSPTPLKKNVIRGEIDQFRYIKIQPKTIDLSTRLWGINPTNSVFIPPEPRTEVYCLWLNFNNNVHTHILRKRSMPTSNHIPSTLKNSNSPALRLLVVHDSCKKIS